MKDRKIGQWTQKNVHDKVHLENIDINIPDEVLDVGKNVVKEIVKDQNPAIAVAVDVAEVLLKDHDNLGDNVGVAVKDIIVDVGEAQINDKLSAITLGKINNIDEAKVIIQTGKTLIEQAKQ